MATPLDLGSFTVQVGVLNSLQMNVCRELGAEILPGVLDTA